MHKGAKFQPDGRVCSCCRGLSGHAAWLPSPAVWLADFVRNQRTMFATLFLLLMESLKLRCISCASVIDLYNSVLLSTEALLTNAPMVLYGQLQGNDAQQLGNDASFLWKLGPMVST